VSGNHPTAGYVLIAVATLHQSLLLPPWSDLPNRSFLSDGMPLGISLVSVQLHVGVPSEHNILMHLRSTNWCCSPVDRCSAPCTAHQVTSSLVRETPKPNPKNYGYKFGQEEETYKCRSRLLCQFNLPIRFAPTRVNLFLAAWPVIGIWFTSWASAPWRSTSTASTSTSPSLTHNVIGTWQMLNRANWDGSDARSV